MVKYCAMYGCLSTSKEKNRRFFRFPKEEMRCKQWIEISGRSDLSNKSIKYLNSNYHVCDLHFVSSDHLRKYLNRNVIPSQNLPYQEIINKSKSTQTDNNTKELTTQEVSTQTLIQCSSNSTQTNCDILSFSSKSSQTKLHSANIQCKRKPRFDLKTDCKRRKYLESQLKALSTTTKNNKMSPQLKKLLDLHYQPNSRGNRYDNEYKSFALNVYTASPSTYKALAKTMSLPSLRTLRRMKIKNNA